MHTTCSSYIYYHFWFLTALFFCLITYLDCQMFQNVMLNRLKVWNCIYFLNCKQICSFQVNMQHNLTWQQCSILLFEMFFFHNFVNMLYQYAECSTYCAECSTLVFDSIPKNAEECCGACAVRAGFGLCLQQHCCWLIFIAVMSSLSGMKSFCGIR